MKGLRSANDLVDSSAAADVVDVDDDGFAAIVSDFVAASFAVVVVVVVVFLGASTPLSLMDCSATIQGGRRGLGVAASLSCLQV